MPNSRPKATRVERAIDRRSARATKAIGIQALEEPTNRRLAEYLKGGTSAGTAEDRPLLRAEIMNPVANGDIRPFPGYHAS